MPLDDFNLLSKTQHPRLRDEGENNAESRRSAVSLRHERSLALEDQRLSPD